MKEVEKSLDSQLWHACAGGMVQMPPANSKVFYFPQGHAEHTLANVDFGVLPRVPALVLCRVSFVKFMADPETDEVFAKIGLCPVGNTEQDYDDDGLLGSNGLESPEKPSSFAKTLTQSDANNGGGFSVPRYCAETIFPRLDYAADPPVQTVIAKDVHGEVWKFRHIYRGTPRRHLLTTGWSNFVNQKKLVAGDSIVFMRADNGDLCIGIRRARRGGIGGTESPSGWSCSPINRVSAYGGFSVFLREDENKLMRSGGSKGRGKVSPESVIEAAALAASGQPFEVVYYPRVSTPEFCVKASVLSAAIRIRWCSGMRFKMAFETEDSSRISWFMGTIASVQVSDPIRWPNSPWRLLQVTWDEPDLLQNVKRVNPWLVELASNMPVIHISPFSPPRKKFRLPQHRDFPYDGQFPMPSSFSNNPLGPRSPFVCLSDSNLPAGIQGARHAQFGVPLADPHPTNKEIPLPDLHPLGLFPSSFQSLDPHTKITNDIIQRRSNGNDNISCLLTIGNSSHKLEKTDNVKAPRFILFGQPILTEQQISDESLQVPKECSSYGNQEKADRSSHNWLCINENVSSTGFLWDRGFCNTDIGLNDGHCKVFLQSEDVGRNLDLSVLGSYEELYITLANMFGTEKSEMLSRVLYRDATGAVKRAGDEPFSVFVKTAKRLTILMDSESHNMGRNWVTGLRNVEHGLDSSNPTGPLSIFA